MKVLLINGSPHKAGCTYTALAEIEKELKREAIETEFFQIEMQPVRGCIACNRCSESQKCVFEDDLCNQLLKKMQEADGIIVGSPVYYAGPNGALCALLDRAFYAGKRTLEHKPAACVLSCRRGGASAAFDRLNKYFTINQMPVVTSQYWNAVHGMTAEDVKQDLEGLQIMRTLGKNMAWMLKNQKKDNLPVQEPRQVTNFIRS